MDFLCIFCLGIERTTMNINCLFYVSNILSRNNSFLSKFQFNYNIFIKSQIFPGNSRKIYFNPPCNSFPGRFAGMNLYS